MYSKAAVLSLALALGAQAAPVLEERQLGGCKKVHLIHARGTGEPGDLGMIVGEPFRMALAGKFPGQLSAAGVRYGADIIGAITGAMNPAGQGGAQTMARMAKQKMAECPGTKVVLGGYSQGAEQVHGALKNLGMQAREIGAAVTFGDPMNMGILQAAGGLIGGWGSLPKERAKVFCYPGDPVCGGIGISHLSYAGSAGEAASFVARAIGMLPSGGGVATGGAAAGGLLGKFGAGKGKDPGPAKGKDAGKDAGGLAGLAGMLGKNTGGGAKDAAPKGKEAKGGKGAKGGKSADSDSGSSDTGGAKGKFGGFGKGKASYVDDMPHFSIDS